ncbi:MAG: hypothetical protein KY467_05635, partial [Gemmatimonadetes bacterium]|nr:hypothetical protein [Gemmatimonadota bacterium]
TASRLLIDPVTSRTRGSAQDLDQACATHAAAHAPRDDAPLGAAAAAFRDGEEDAGGAAEFGDFAEDGPARARDGAAADGGGSERGAAGKQPDASQHYDTRDPREDEAA